MSHCSIDQVRASHGSQNEDKTLLHVLTTLPQG